MNLVIAVERIGGRKRCAFARRVPLVHHFKHPVRIVLVGFAFAGAVARFAEQIHLTECGAVLGIKSQCLLQLSIALIELSSFKQHASVLNMRSGTDFVCYRAPSIADRFGRRNRSGKFSKSFVIRTFGGNGRRIFRVSLEDESELRIYFAIITTLASGLGELKAHGGEALHCGGRFCGGVVRSDLFNKLHGTVINF